MGYLLKIIRGTGVKLWKRIVDYRAMTVYYTYMVTKRQLKIWRSKLDPTLTGRDRTREIARIRDKHKCQMCGKPWIEGHRRFDIHHLEGCGFKSMYYDRVEDIDNLITYCHKCHLGLHNVRLKMSQRTGQQKLSAHPGAIYKRDIIYT